MKRESVATRTFRKKYLEFGMNGEQAFHKTKLLLKIYRDVVWSVNERIDNAISWGYEANDKNINTGLDYLCNFAPDIDKEKFESEVCYIFENKCFIDIIDKALYKIREYPYNGEIYFDIINKQYILKYNYTEKEILENLNMERSIFYDRKREAINLFGIALWGYTIPQFKVIFNN